MRRLIKSANAAMEKRYPADSVRGSRRRLPARRAVGAGPQRPQPAARRVHAATVPFASRVAVASPPPSPPSPSTPPSTPPPSVPPPAGGGRRRRSRRPRALPPASAGDAPSATRHHRRRTRRGDSASSAPRPTADGLAHRLADQPTAAVDPAAARGDASTRFDPTKAPRAAIAEPAVRRLDRFRTTRRRRETTRRERRRRRWRRRRRTRRRGRASRRRPPSSRLSIRRATRRRRPCRGGLYPAAASDADGSKGVDYGAGRPRPHAHSSKRGGLVRARLGPQRLGPAPAAAGAPWEPEGSNGELGQRAGGGQNTAPPAEWINAADDDGAGGGGADARAEFSARQARFAQLKSERRPPPLPPPSARWSSTLDIATKLQPLPQKLDSIAQ